MPAHFKKQQKKYQLDTLYINNNRKCKLTKIKWGKKRTYGTPKYPTSMEAKWKYLQVVCLAKKNTKIIHNNKEPHTREGSQLHICYQDATWRHKSKEKEWLGQQQK